jgi:hypothetical protein
VNPRKDTVDKSIFASCVAEVSTKYTYLHHAQKMKLKSPGGPGQKHFSVGSLKDFFPPVSPTKRL